jgi:hypothetical protein
MFLVPALFRQFAALVSTCQLIETVISVHHNVKRLALGGAYPLLELIILSIDYLDSFSIGTFLSLPRVSVSKQPVSILMFGIITGKQGFLYAGFASAVAADVLIAISLCVSLSRRRTGFRRYVGTLQTENGAA